MSVVTGYLLNKRVIMKSSIITEQLLRLPKNNSNVQACITFESELRRQTKPRTFKRPVRTPIKGPRD